MVQVVTIGQLAVASDSQVAGFVADPDSETAGAVVAALALGQPNGAAQLDGAAKVPEEHLPDRLSRNSLVSRFSLAGAPSDWFRQSRYGLFVHYTYGGNAFPQTSYRDGTVPSSVEALASQLDAERFAADAESFGVEYVVFTAWHYAMHALYPSAVLNAALPGHSSTTDALRPLITALKQRGIKVVFYVHAIDGHDLTASEQAATGWNDSTNGYATWSDLINSLMVELGERYGADLDGLWVDMMQDPGFATRLPDAGRLRRSLKAGNPSRVIIGNQGTVDGFQPSRFRNVPDHITREYIGPPADMSNWVAGNSHLAAIPLTTGEWWAKDPQGGPSIVMHSAESMFRFSVLQAGTSRYSGGMAWAVSPYAGSGSTSLWEDGVETTMEAIAALMAPVARSVKGTVASPSFRTSNTVTLATLPGGFVATTSADGASEFIHVLTAPAGQTVTLPAPADGAVFSWARNVATGRVATLTPLDGGGYALTKHSDDSWSATDTVFELHRVSAPLDTRWVGANEWASRNGSPLVSNGIGGRYSAWSLGPDNPAQIETTFVVPAEWNTFALDLYWTTDLTAQAGNAVLTLTRAEMVPGGSTTTDDATAGQGYRTPAVRDVIERWTVFENLRARPFGVNHFRIARDAASAGDTGPTVKIMGALLRRLS
jgi:hypothetical protein